MKITTKLTILFSLGVICIIFANYFITSNLVSDELEKRIGETQLEITIQTMDKIDRHLYEAHQDISLIARSKRIQEYIIAKSNSLDLSEKQEKEYRVELQDFSIYSGPWDVIAIIDTNKNKILTTEEGSSSNTINNELENIKAFESAMTGIVYYSDIVISSETSNPTILFSAPIRNNDIVGRPIIGVAIGNMSLPTIKEIVSNLPQKAYLFTKEGLLIANEKEGQSSDNFINNKVNRTLLKMVENEISGTEVTKSINNEEDSLYTFAPQLGFLNYIGSSWSLVIETPLTTITGQINNVILKTVFIVLSIIIIIILIIMIIFYYIFIKPIKTLTKTAETISKKGVLKGTGIERGDEIGKLAKAFDLMTNNLIKSRQNIEGKVEERTEYLQKLNKLMVNREKKMIELKKQIKKLEDIVQGLQQK